MDAAIPRTRTIPATPPRSSGRLRATVIGTTAFASLGLAGALTVSAVQQQATAAAYGDVGATTAPGSESGATSGSSSAASGLSAPGPLLGGSGAPQARSHGS